MWQAQATLPLQGHQVVLVDGTRAVLPRKFIREGNLIVIGAQMQHNKMVTQVGRKQMWQARATLPLQGHLALADGVERPIILLEVEVVVEVQSGNQRDHTVEVTVGGKPKEPIPQAPRTSTIQDHPTMEDGTSRLAEDQHGDQMDQTGEVAIVNKEGVQILH